MYEATVVNTLSVAREKTVDLGLNFKRKDSWLNKSFQWEVVPLFLLHC